MQPAHWPACVDVYCAQLNCAQSLFPSAPGRASDEERTHADRLSHHSTVTGGRDGKAVTDDGKLNVKLITPKELGGPGGEATNPEQLFAAGYAACFLSAIKYVARNQKIAMPDSSAITASVGVGPRDDGKGFGLDVALQVSLPGLERAQAEALVEQAHVVCPYSHATRGNINVALSAI